MRRRLSTLTLLLLIASPGIAQPQHAGVVAIMGGDAYDICSGRWRTRTTVQGWPEPTTTVGRPIRTLEPNRLVEPNDRSDAVTVILRPGRNTARRNLAFEAQEYGAVRLVGPQTPQRTVTLRVRAGAVLEHLMHIGEAGDYFVYDGRVYYTDDRGVFGDSTMTSPGAEAETRLWVRLVARGAGRPAAWVLVSDEDEFEELEWQCE